MNRLIIIGVDGKVATSHHLWQRDLVLSHPGYEGMLVIQSDAAFENDKPVPEGAEFTVVRAATPTPEPAPAHAPEAVA